MKRLHWEKSLVGLTLAALAAAYVPVAATAQDADASTRIIDYFRRKQNLPPEFDARIKDVRDSAIRGARSATIELSLGNQKRDVEILMSGDGRYVVFGPLEDMTVDPFAKIAARLTAAGQPVRGPENAPVTIVEFSDFQCPYCARAHKTLTAQVLAQYGDKVRMVYKNYPLPFHKWARAAAVAGECVFEQSPDAFWKLYDYYFEHQREIKPKNLRQKTLEALPDDAVDAAKLTACLDGKQAAARVDADLAEARSVEINSAPAFVINGRTISGAQPFQNFKAVIDDELQRAGQGE